MSLKDLLEMKMQNVIKIIAPHVISVNVLEKVENGLYLIEDASRTAFLKVDEENMHKIEVGRGLLIAQPKYYTNDIVTTENPQKMQRMRKRDFKKDNDIKVMESKKKKEGISSDKKVQKNCEETMNYRDSFNYHGWSGERKLADQIMIHVKRHKLQLKLDRLTKGAGDCFMVAVLQQLQREEVFVSCTEEVKRIAEMLDHQELRKLVKDFVMRSRLKKVREMKENYNAARDADLESGRNTRSWNQYWDNMLTKGVWADSHFVQATSLYLAMDIGIVDTSCNAEHPYMDIECGKKNAKKLWIGLVTDTHYQSLLVNRNSSQEDDSTQEVDEKTDDAMEIDETTQDDNVNSTQEDNKDSNQCPVCKNKFDSVLKHLVLTGLIMIPFLFFIYFQKNAFKRVARVSREAEAGGPEEEEEGGRGPG